MSDIIKVGEMDNSDGTHESQNRVYSTEGVAPTISTMQGGNLQPKILTTELIRVGAIGVDVGESLRYNNPRIHQGNLVYDMNGLAATLTAQPCGGAGGYTPCYIDMKEIQCLRYVRTDYAKEIRKQYESGELDAGMSELQQLEPRNDDLSNTITTVQKDNLIMEVEQCKVLGGLSDEMKSNNGTQYYQQDRVYSVGDVAMCIPSNLPGGSYNYAVDTSGIKQVGYLENGTGQHQSNTVYSTDSLSPTIATLQGGTQQIKIMDGEDMSEEQKTIKIRQATEQGYIECEVGGVANFAYPESDVRRGRVIDNGQTSPTLQAGEPSICKVTSIGIRKLTPRECWRLMDFTDEQFDKAEKVNSSTQLYKEAGNSIVVACLEAIFSQLGIGEEWNKRDQDFQ